VLLGRGSELGELQRLVAGLAAGAGFSVVVQGGAGIGKTAVLDAVVTGGEGGARVLRASGTQRESELAFRGARGAARAAGRSA
jgi:hypothetical protein